MVSLSFFGYPLVTRNGVPVHLERRKVTGLLAYLAVTGLRHGREALAELLFPGQDRERARADLRNTLSNLADVVGHGFLRIEHDAVSLPKARGLHVDTREFRRLAAAAAQAHPAGDEDRCLRALTEADRLVRGEFLAGFSLKDSERFDEWQRREQEALRLEHARVLEHLADILEARQEYAEAERFAWKLIALDELDEAAYRRLMRLRALAGHRADALALFDRCAEVLRRELGVVPDIETLEVQAQIRDGTLEGGRPILPAGTALPTAVQSPSAAPLPAACSSPWRNLPPFRGKFIGREAELEAVAELLACPEVRLLTLVGPGGTGKTRLALQAAETLKYRFANGACFVDLSPLRSDGALFPAIAEALRLREDEGRSASSIVLDFLAGRQVLLILDNFEHLLPAVPHLATLLSACPSVQVLATSREALGLQSERVYEVQPLSLAHATPEEARRCEAVRLFVERARAAEPSFVLDDGLVPVVVSICARLDGLPLAIELAVARLRMFSPRALLETLDHRLEVLTNGPRDLPIRQRTLRDEIDWSHELLDDVERRLFRRLSGFAAGFTAEAAAAVGCDTDDGSAPSVLRLLAALVGKCLLEVCEGAPGPRFRMLQTIREYARERLQESGESATVQASIAAWFANLADTAEPLLHGTDQDQWFDRLEAESANISASLEWLGDSGDAAMGLRLAGAVGWFWFRRCRFTEGRSWLGLFDRRAGSGGPPLLRARALHYLGWITSAAGRDYGRDPMIARCFAASLHCCPAGEGARYRAASMAWLGWMRRLKGDEGSSLARRSVALARESGDSWTIALCLIFSHKRPFAGGERAETERALDEAVALAAAAGDPFLRCEALTARGELHRVFEEWTPAEQLFRASRDIAREHDDLRSMALAAFGLADVLHSVGRALETKALYLDVLRRALDVGARSYLPVIFGGMSLVAIAEGRPHRAARLWGASDAAFDPAKVFPVILPADLGLDEKVGRAEWSLGHSWNAEEAGAYAISDE